MQEEYWNIRIRSLLCAECPEHEAFPIRGDRFKCINCRFYNLCALCHKYTTHNKNHIFAIMKRSVNPICEANLFVPGVLYDSLEPSDALVHKMKNMRLEEEEPSKKGDPIPIAQLIDKLDGW